MSSRAVLVTAPHELDAHLIFGNTPGSDREDAHGLAPYLAFLSIINQNDGSKRYSIEFRGMKVSGRFYYQRSGGIGSINHPDTEKIETVKEPRITWEVVDENDPVGERSGHFHIRPRNPDMRSKDGHRMNVPRDLVGIDVRAQGSNLDHGLYPSLFRAIAAELGVSSRYFETLHEYSNVSDAAMHVRVRRDCSGPVHAVDGVLARIGNLLANDREGYRKHVADDRDEPGYYHSATIGSKRAAELVDAIGRQLDTEDIRVFVDHQGIGKLAAAFHYTLRVMDGELTQRTAANKLGVHPVEGVTVITALQDVVEEAVQYDPYLSSAG